MVRKQPAKTIQRAAVWGTEASKYLPHLSTALQKITCSVPLELPGKFAKQSFGEGRLGPWWRAERSFVEGERHVDVGPEWMQTWDRSVCIKSDYLSIDSQTESKCNNGRLGLNAVAQFHTIFWSNLCPPNITTYQTDLKQVFIQCIGDDYKAYSVSQSSNSHLLIESSAEGALLPEPSCKSLFFSNSSFCSDAISWSFSVFP